MALGGGKYLVQNKVLPGTYINFISASRADSQLSNRGYIAVPLIMDWGIENEIFTVESSEFQKESLKRFGYDYNHEKMRNLRELFKNGKTAYCFRLNEGLKSECEIAMAKYSGIRGNDLTIVVKVDSDSGDTYEIDTYLDHKKVDSQKAINILELVDNEYVSFKKNAELSEYVKTNQLSGGTNKGSITGEDYQKFLDRAEAYNFHTLICNSKEKSIVDLFTAFTKRLRDENGIKFQMVAYRCPGDYEGIISVENSTVGEENEENALVYWVGGASAGCEVNKSNTNKIYDGDYTIDVNYKQSQLESNLKQGKLMFHKVGNSVRILDDINTFISVMEEKNSDFNSNQVIRILDQIANDIGVLFNTNYLGKVQNNISGRISLWNDIVTYCKELELIQAIEDFSAEDVTVNEGSDKKSVIVGVAVKPINAMTKLYMSVIVE